MGWSVSLANLQITTFQKEKRDRERDILMIWNSPVLSHRAARQLLVLGSIFRHKLGYSITPNTQWLKEIRFIETLIDATSL